ncbi:hypothetical protein GGH96_002819 [Coemansia sp. RSA 1972]|nr:hypothetical protein GGH96_002819 [Coemansia sp. RSA 1972]
MRIAVVGGMGAVAQHVVVQAMEAGHCVSWMVKPTDTLPDTSLETDYTQVLCIVRSSWDNSSKYDELVAECDAVIVALDFNHTRPEQFVPIQHILQKSMRKYKVERIILVTMHGSAESSRQLDWELWAKLNINQVFYIALGTVAPCWSIISQYTNQEQVVKSVESLKYTILRPAAVTDGPATGTYLASPSHIFGGYISAADVADCTLKALDHEMDVSQAFSIAYSSRVA